MQQLCYAKKTPFTIVIFKMATPSVYSVRNSDLLHISLVPFTGGGIWEFYPDFIYVSLCSNSKLVFHPTTSQNYVFQDHQWAKFGNPNVNAQSSGFKYNVRPTLLLKCSLLLAPRTLLGFPLLHLTGCYFPVSFTSLFYSTIMSQRILKTSTILYYL